MMRTHAEQGMVTLVTFPFPMDEIKIPTGPNPQ